MALELLSIPCKATVSIFSKKHSEYFVLIHLQMSFLTIFLSFILNRSKKIKNLAQIMLQKMLHYRVIFLKSHLVAMPTEHAMVRQRGCCECDLHHYLVQFQCFFACP